MFGLCFNIIIMLKKHVFIKLIITLCIMKLRLHTFTVYFCLLVWGSNVMNKYSRLKPTPPPPPQTEIALSQRQFGRTKRKLVKINKKGYPEFILTL